MIFSAASFGTPGVPQPDRRHHQALLEHAGGVRRHGTRYGAADVVVVAERLDERDHLAVVEDRHGDAQVGQVPDAALGQVDVVVEEHVAGPHRLDRIVAHHRLHQRRVRPAGQLAQPAVVDAGPEVVRVADHRRPRGPADGRLHLLPRSRRGCPRRSRAGSGPRVTGSPLRSRTQVAEPVDGGA